MTPSAQNVLDVFHAATMPQVQAGATWYADAYAFAGKLSDTYGVSRTIASGVIAAGSPLCGWGQNKANAERWVAQGFGDRYLSVGIVKVNDMLTNGTDPLKVLLSRKVRNFYLSILTGGMHYSAVCIDRHAWDIAIGSRSDNNGRNITDKRFDEAADAYRSAARIVGMSPAQIQAITWVSWRTRFWAEGAFDGKAA